MRPAARGRRASSHRDRRGARIARRETREWQTAFHHGLPGRAVALAAAIALTAVMFRLPVSTAAQTPPAAELAPGVSDTLATARSQRIRDVRYDLGFTIPAGTKAPVTGRETLTFTLSDATEDLPLDFEPRRAEAVHAVSVNGRTTDTTLRDGHVVLPAAALIAGENRITLAFDAGDGPLNRNDEYLYTIFVPARAHEAFPCFDQPDLKARWTLTLDVPDGWETLANGAETTRDAGGGRTRVAFAATEPIPTYLFAFAAGRFSVERAERHGRAFRMFHRETDAQKIARNRDAIFDLHAAALSWLEQYTGIAYPFGKFDFLLVPAFQFGGMEHPGAIFYNAPGLLLDELATQNQYLERASTIAHETTHMWFGDLVTMRWFTDVWMKEVFANFMAAKIVNPSFPAVNHELRFLLAHYPAAYDVDRTAGSNAIRQPLANLSEAGTLYGSIIYEKAPIVMRQLEMLLGPGGMREGLREYLQQFAFGNASWSDLIRILGDHTTTDLAAWSHAWVEEPGRPRVTTELATKDRRIERLAFAQDDPIPARGLTWTQDLQVTVGYAGRIESLPVHLEGRQAEVPAARGLAAPLFVLPNGGGIGYGEFHLDPASVAWLSTHAPEVNDALTRGSIWVTLWDAMLDGEVPPDRLIDLALRSLPRERDELNTQRILGYLRRAYWQFTPGSRRTALAPVVERTLREGLRAAPTPSLKGAYFAAIRDTALTGPALDWLTAIWAQKISVEGLTLAESDDILLAQDIAVRGRNDWRAIVTRQIARTKNPDRQARLQFIVPALSADPRERAAFFESLKDPANRRHEPWVLDGLRALHHPLRGAASEPFILPSLEMLREIQRTGDIFFPARWTDVTLGGYQSSAAAGVVRGFVDRLPAGYPDRLRRIVLSAADDLFRASRLVRQ